MNTKDQSKYQFEKKAERERYFRDFTNQIANLFNEDDNEKESRQSEKEDLRKLKINDNM